MTGKTKRAVSYHRLCYLWLCSQFSQEVPVPHKPLICLKTTTKQQDSLSKT